MGILIKGMDEIPEDGAVLVVRHDNGKAYIKHARTYGYSMELVKLPAIQPVAKDINVLTNDCISRQMAIDDTNTCEIAEEELSAAKDTMIRIMREQSAVQPEPDCALKEFGNCWYSETGCADCEVKANIRNALSAQWKRKLMYTDVSDTISRQAALDALSHMRSEDKNGITVSRENVNCMLRALPSAQPTLCGYNIEHLILIANVLRKENLPPERVVEALTDIGRIVSIVKDEFEESLRKAVEQCKV